MKTARQRFKIGDRVIHKGSTGTSISGTVKGFTKGRLFFVKVLADGEIKPVLWSANYWERVLPINDVSLYDYVPNPELWKPEELPVSKLPEPATETFTIPYAVPGTSIVAGADDSASTRYYYSDSLSRLDKIAIGIDNAVAKLKRWYRGVK